CRPLPAGLVLMQAASRIAALVRLVLAADRAVGARSLDHDLQSVIRFVWLDPFLCRGVGSLPVHRQTNYPGEPGEFHDGLWSLLGDAAAHVLAAAHPLRTRRSLLSNTPRHRRVSAPAGMVCGRRVGD